MSTPVFERLSFALPAARRREALFRRAPRLAPTHSGRAGGRAPRRARSLALRANGARVVITQGDEVRAAARALHRAGLYGAPLTLYAPAGAHMLPKGDWDEV